MFCFDVSPMTKDGARRSDFRDFLFIKSVFSGLKLHNNHLVSINHRLINYGHSLVLNSEYYLIFQQNFSAFMGWAARR